MSIHSVITGAVNASEMPLIQPTGTPYYFQGIPKEVIIEIFSHLDLKTVLSLIRRVCKTFHFISKDEQFLKALFQKHAPILSSLKCSSLPIERQIYLHHVLQKKQIFQEFKGAYRVYLMCYNNIKIDPEKSDILKLLAECEIMGNCQLAINNVEKNLKKLEEKS